MHSRSVWGAVSLLVAFSAVAATPKISVRPVACLTRVDNARITAVIDGPVKSARVYFRVADSTCDENFVEMRPSEKDPTLYWAVLPLIGPEGNAIVYRVVADFTGVTKPLSSETFTATVKSTCIVDPLSRDELRATQNIVLGLTSPKQTGVPCELQCRGITSILTVSGDLQPNEACRRLLAASKWPVKELLIGGGVAGAIIVLKKNGDNRTPSPARP